MGIMTDYPPEKETLRMERYFFEIYTKFKLTLYRKIFSRTDEREEGLSALEQFCAETIYAMDSPTVHEFAEFANLSAPNAAYKIHSLIRKGYIVKVRSQTDRRSYHLEVTEKYLATYGLTYDYVKTVLGRIRGRIPEEDVEAFERVLKVISEELMPEATERTPRIRL